VAVTAELAESSADPEISLSTTRDVPDALRTAEETDEQYFVSELYRIGAELIVKNCASSEAEPGIVVLSS